MILERQETGKLLIFTNYQEVVMWSVNGSEGLFKVELTVLKHNLNIIKHSTHDYEVICQEYVLSDS